jgi:HlyD family secretion protein
MNPWSARMPLLTGFVALAILIFGIGAWSATANIAGAIVASGQVEVESNRQVVQHPDGGVVAEILVDDGDEVQAGTVLIRFDDTAIRSDLKIVDDQLYEMIARRGRLSAERDGLDAIAFDDDLLLAADGSEDIAGLVQGQQSLFEARKTTLDEEIAQLRERQTQIGLQIEGTEAQLTAVSRQLDLMKQELSDQQKLLDQGLTEAGRVLGLQREQAAMQGSVGELTAAIAESRGRIAEIEIEILKQQSSLREEAAGTLRDMQFRENELRQRSVALNETLDRLDIRAPVSGVIYGMTVHAVRSVVRAAEPVLYIVPQDAPWVIASRVDPVQVDNIRVGQDASLTFAAFDQRTTPQLDGTVTKVSADALTDQRTGESYYAAEILPKPGELAKLGDLDVVPGMPVTAFIQTGERTALSYLVKPFTDYFNKAFREQ